MLLIRTVKLPNAKTIHLDMSSSSWKLALALLGPQLEAAWRARHKWAAQKAARVMTDCYPSPPMRPALSFAQKVSIGMVLVLSNQPGVPAPSLQSQDRAAAWTAPGHNPYWLISASLPGGTSSSLILLEMIQPSTQGCACLSRPRGLIAMGMAKGIDQGAL